MGMQGGEEMELGKQIKKASSGSTIISRGVSRTNLCIKANNIKLGK